MTRNSCWGKSTFNRREGCFSDDAQYRPRKSPRKRFKVARTTASFMIDQLKSVFWCPVDFMSRIQTRRNWHPEYFMKYLYDNRRSCNNECETILRDRKRNFAPEAPKIYSIGLHSGARCFSDSDDLSCGAMRNFKKHFSVVRRPTDTCKYWIGQSTSMSTDVYLPAHTNRQTIIPDCTKSTEIIPKYNRAEKSNHNSHNQLYEHIEEKESDISDTLRNDRIVDDRSFIPGDFKDFSVRKSQKYDSSCMTRDAQIQTSSRKSLRRRKMKTRSKPAAEKISRRNDNESSRIVADFRAARSHGKRNYCDEPWLRVRAREKKRAEYVDKFTAVNRQIEEITATLRETCCDGEDSARNNLENCDEYFSSISDDAKVSAMNRSGVENGLNIAGRRTASEEKNSLVNVMRIEGGSRNDLCNKTVREISHVDNLNNETVSEETLASRNLEKIPNNADRDSVRAIKETVYSSNRISRSKIKAKYLFDLDLAKKGDELQERSIESEPFNKVCPKNNFAILRNDERARNSAESLANLGDSRYCKIIEEKLGETAVLKDIKKRIDRDFDGPPAERSENDTEDFLTVSQKSSDLNNVIDVTSATTIEEFKSTPLITSTNLESTETEIHGSMSISAISECSNKNSTPSKYFSCTQIPSLMSLTRNEDELAALETIDCSTIVHDSHSNLYSNYYDSCSNLSSNHRSLSNLDSSFDRSRSSLEYIAQYACPNKFPAVETTNEPYDTFEVSDDRDSFAENKIRERPLFEDDKRSRKEWQVEKRYTADSTLETSKSSRYVGSIDSGVFSSSMIDLHPAEDSFDIDGTEFKEKSYAGKLDELSAVDSASDSNCTDDTLDRKVNNVVRDLTKNLILCERKARMKLKARDARYSQHVLSRTCKFNKSLYDTCCDLFNSPRRFNEDERIVSISTPSLLSLSDSEIDDCEPRCQRVFC